MAERMNDNDVIKALECCVEGSLKKYPCQFCPLQDKECYSGNALKKPSLDLIKRQKAEIIARTEEYNDMLEQRNRCEAEIERLETMHSEMCIGMKVLKKKAIKEFAERLITELYKVPNANEFFIKGWTEKIHDIAKELSEAPVKQACT